MDRVERIIREKMRALGDFGICKENDQRMKDTLYNVVKRNPDKDPQYVLDYYCRPIIQSKVNSWK